MIKKRLLKILLPMKFTVLNIILVLNVFSLQTASAYSEKYKWDLVKDDGGIKVFIADSKSSDIVIARSSIVLNATISSVQSMLDNIESRHEWIPYLKKSELIKYESDSESLEYSLFSAPWPATDRDFVYRLLLISSSDNEKIYKMRSEVSDLAPVSSNAIRADLFESVYTLTAIDEETTIVNLTFHADLKGWLPNWIVNIVQKALPYRTLKNLRNELIKRKYNAVKF